MKNKFFNYNFFPKNRKALSAVVIMVVMVALVMAIMAIVFTLTKKTVEENIEQTESCGLNLLDKLSINSEFVCYGSDKLVFSVNRGDIEIDKLLIAIETETQIIQFQLDKNDQDLCGGTNKLYNYISGSEFNCKDTVSLPPKKGGKTYIATGFSEEIIGIQIAPFIGGNQCEVVDTITNIVDCSSTTILD